MENIKLHKVNNEDYKEAKDLLFPNETEDEIEDYVEDNIKD